MKKIIVIEGVDAVGKTTVSKGLSEYRGALYYKTPGFATLEDRNYYDSFDISIEERFNFYLNCCKQDLIEILKISEYKEVICDRFISSTISHHVALEPKLDVSEAIKLDDTVKRIQVLLIADFDVIEKRLLNRNSRTRFEENKDLYIKAHNEFLRAKNDYVLDTSSISIKDTIEIINGFINNILTNE